MLKLENINLFYEGIHALKDLSLEVKEGEIVTLIGANGAGKTSTLRAISGLTSYKEGNIIYKDKNIKKLSPHQIVSLELSHVPEGRKIFTNLTVYENLLLGGYLIKDKKEIKNLLDDVFKKFPRLLERKTQLAGTLSGGEQQMLAIGRALMNKPKMLILDEPSMGLAPLIVKEIFSIIKEINNSGTTILLVEQNANMALSISNRAYVLENGRITLSGNSKDILNNENVKKAYLGN